MKQNLERSDPGVATAVAPLADLLREGRELLLDLVDRTEVRDAAAAWTGRVNTVTARTDRVDADVTTLVRALGTWFSQPA
ncbi:aromatic-ring hydroxylase C-terminal domain-containing protein [Streptomyces chartreusis]